MARLIAFSGGVESVALLTLSKPGDKLLVIDSWRSGQIPYIPENLEKIARHYNLDVEKMSLTSGSKVQCIQMMILFAFGTLRAQSDSGITEYWLGMHNQDLSWQKVEEFKRTQEAWAILHPEIKLHAPLRHETKLQQWNRIPDEIKPFVHSCVEKTPCGVCGKCAERIKYGIPLQF